MGGIGNQIFQYCFARSIANKFNAELKIDISSYENYSYTSNFELKELIPNLQFTDHKIMSEGLGVYYLNEDSINSLGELKYIPEDCRVIVISGYWQKEEFLDQSVVLEFYNYMKMRFSEKFNGYLNENPDYVKSIAVHVRRRDYAHMGLCKEEYYIGCIESLVASEPKAKIYLFSDEPNYSISFLTKYFPDRICLIKAESDFTELYFLTQCQNIIISNSTYSWWGAYFNERTKKNIIRPSPWILQDLNLDPCPKRWVKINNSVCNQIIDPESIRSCYEQVINSSLK